MPLIDLSPQGSLFYLDELPPTALISTSKVVLLLHGLGVNSASWQLQIPALAAAGYRVLAPDAPGFGQSTFSGCNTIASMTDSILRLLDKLQVQLVDIVGISMGGTLALQIALEQPQSVHHLVLVNTFARLKLGNPYLFPYYALRFVLIHVLGLPEQAKIVARRIFPHSGQEILRAELEAQVCQANIHAYRSTMRALVQFNVLKQLPTICKPTLVITGDCDTTVHPDNQRPLVEKIPSARQMIIPGAGHAVSVEKPQLFNQVLLEFLSRTA